MSYKYLSKIVLVFVLIQYCIAITFSQTISGRISSSNEGIKHVVVTDGRYFDQTDADGKYKLKISDEAKFVYLSTLSGYLPQRKRIRPLFFEAIKERVLEGYDFQLEKSVVVQTKHIIMVHADPQLFSLDNLIPYNHILDDCMSFIEAHGGNCLFGIDCGELVGDKPELYSYYVLALDRLDIPFYRVIGNHGMTLNGRSHETSYQTFEKWFGPSYYSFNRGKVHYVVLNDVFYLGRDYFYAGYLNEKQMVWLEKDLSYIKEGTPVFVAMHIPSRLEKEQVSFEYSSTNIAGRVSNANSLHELLKPFRTHLLTGHTHYNRNIEYSERLYEHITAAISGMWWQGDLSLDDTPLEYGIYEVNGDEVTWYFKSAGFPKENQLRVHSPGSFAVYTDDIIANVWNWDDKWKIKWLEDGIVMGTMSRIDICDPLAEELCVDKDKLQFKWIFAIPNEHMFRATVRNKNARIEVHATDRFGNLFQVCIINNNH